MNGFLCAYTFNLRIFFWRYRKYFCHAEFIHDDISLIRFVIPGLTTLPRLDTGNPVFFWIPAFAGMTAFAMINVAVYSSASHPQKHLRP